MHKPLALAALLGLALQARASPERQAQAMLDALRDLGGVPGMSAAVWQDGKLRWQGVSGLRDVEQIQGALTILPSNASACPP